MCIRDRPITGTFFNSVSFEKKSLIPLTNKSSGPTTTILISFSKTKAFKASKSEVSIATFVPCAFVPAFPGAINNSYKEELCAIFHAKEWSLPPDPRSNILIFSSVYLQYFNNDSKIAFPSSFAKRW